MYLAAILPKDANIDPEVITAEEVVYDRIAGALADPGYEVCDQTVGNVLQRHALFTGSVDSGPIQLVIPIR